MSASDSGILAAERRNRIRNLLQDRGVLRVDDLSETLGVSAATVRRDLATLDARGQIRKVHGGAVAVESRLEEPVFDAKAEIAAAEKQAIAETAAGLVKPTDCVFLDGGSTVLALAHLLVGMQGLTVVTNSLHVANALAGRGPRVMVVGGELRRLSQTFVGPLTRTVTEQLHFDRAFMGTIGFSLAEGMTTTDPAEAFTKRLVMSRATQVVLMADSSKAQKVAFAHVGDMDDVDVVITDDAIDPVVVREIRELSKDVMTVHPKGT